MMKYFIILGALSFGLTTVAQEKKLVQKTERINGTLFLVDDRGNHCQANPKVVTVKKKDFNKPLGNLIKIVSITSSQIVFNRTSTIYNETFTAVIELMNNI